MVLWNKTKTWNYHKELDKMSIGSSSEVFVTNEKRNWIGNRNVSPRQLKLGYSILCRRKEVVKKISNIECASGMCMSRTELIDGKLLEQSLPPSAWARNPCYCAVTDLLRLLPDSGRLVKSSWFTAQCLLFLTTYLFNLIVIAHSFSFQCYVFLFHLLISILLGTMEDRLRNTWPSHIQNPHSWDAPSVTFGYFPNIYI